MEVFIVVVYNLKVAEDISIERKSFDSLPKAMQFALELAEKRSGRDITTHGYALGGPHSDNRLTNHNSLGSEFGVSYKSEYGSYPMAIMVIKTKISSEDDNTQK